ncbi:MAG: general secretion pathway protein GspB [Rubrivivax sp.]
MVALHRRDRGRRRRPPPLARCGAGAFVGDARNASARSTGGAAPTAPTAPAPPNKPTLLADLPAQQRSQLPQMLIGGAIYSDQPASRFVVINGMVVREGETAAPGVMLERIGPKSAIVRWREMRIELPIN